MFTRRVATFVFASLVAMVIVLTLGTALIAEPWPMLAHDVRRTGATADEIRPPFARKWYRCFPDEGLMTGELKAPPGTLQRPRREWAQQKIAEVSDTQLDEVIWDTSIHRHRARASPEQVDARDRLSTAVQELISRPWQPLIFPAGKHPREAYLIMVDPTETLYTLALAYPFLDRDLQARVVDYVQRLSSGDGPFAGPTCRTMYDPDQGTLRSRYQPAPQPVAVGGVSALSRTG